MNIVKVKHIMATFAMWRERYMLTGDYGNMFNTLFSSVPLATRLSTSVGKAWSQFTLLAISCNSRINF